jgi:hypothetical protein
VNFQPEQFFWVFFALVVGYMFYQVATKGFKGAIFGGQIEKTYGTIEQEATGITGGRLKVHRLNIKGTRKIGIEVVFTSWLSWQMLPVKLSKENARRLIEALTAAVADA